MEEREDPLPRVHDTENKPKKTKKKKTVKKKQSTEDSINESHAVEEDAAVEDNSGTNGDAGGDQPSSSAAKKKSKKMRPNKKKEDAGASPTSTINDDAGDQGGPSHGQTGGGEDEIEEVEFEAILNQQEGDTSPATTAALSAAPLSVRAKKKLRQKDLPPGWSANRNAKRKERRIIEDGYTPPTTLETNASPTTHPGNSSSQQPATEEAGAAPATSKPKQKAKAKKAESVQSHRSDAETPPHSQSSEIAPNTTHNSATPDTQPTQSYPQPPSKHHDFIAQISGSGPALSYGRSPPAFRGRGGFYNNRGGAGGGFGRGRGRGGFFGGNSKFGGGQAIPAQPTNWNSNNNDQELTDEWGGNNSPSVDADVFGKKSEAPKPILESQSDFQTNDDVVDEWVDSSAPAPAPTFPPSNTSTQTSSKTSYTKKGSVSSNRDNRLSKTTISSQRTSAPEEVNEWAGAPPPSTDEWSEQSTTAQPVSKQAPPSSTKAIESSWNSELVTNEWADAPPQPVVFESKPARQKPFSQNIPTWDQPVAESTTGEWGNAPEPPTFTPKTPTITTAINTASEVVVDEWSENVSATNNGSEVDWTSPVNQAPSEPPSKPSKKYKVSGPAPSAPSTTTAPTSDWSNSTHSIEVVSNWASSSSVAADAIDEWGETPAAPKDSTADIWSQPPPATTSAFPRFTKPLNKPSSAGSIPSADSPVAPKKTDKGKSKESMPLSDWMPSTEPSDEWGSSGSGAGAVFNPNRASFTSSDIRSETANDTPPSKADGKPGKTNKTLRKKKSATNVVASSVSWLPSPLEATDEWGSSADSSAPSSGIPVAEPASSSKPPTYKEHAATTTSGKANKGKSSVDWLPDIGATDEWKEPPKPKKEKAAKNMRIEEPKTSKIIKPPAKEEKESTSDFANAAGSTPVVGNKVVGSPPRGTPRKFKNVAENGTAGGSSNQGTPKVSDRPLKRNVFEEYLPKNEVEEALENPPTPEQILACARSSSSPDQPRILVTGILRINKRTFFDSYVTVDGLADDIYIPGKVRRNRAFDGDTVVVQVLHGDELKKEVEKDGDRQEQKRRDEKERVALVAFEKEDDEQEDEPEGIFSSEDGTKPKLFGKVVYILDSPDAHMFVGILSVEAPNIKTPSKLSDGRPVDISVNTIWFKPNDKRVPFLVVPVENAPSEFLKAPKDFDGVLWKASIKKWPIHCQYPYGIVHGKVGLAGSIPIETEALLIENGIVWSDFSPEILECLPATPWCIPPEILAQRRDFRDTRIFSVDPQTAKDLDDALSITEISDDLFEVGVHIADVSFFVAPGSALDAEARNRATTVYLTQKAIPMLPRLLCEELCSLNPGVDRLAFSVTWTIRKSTAEIVGSPWFGRSVIRSCAKLSYDHAQRLIEGKDWEGLPDVTISGSHTVDDVRADTLELYKLSKLLRAKRFEDGALTMNTIKLWFSLDTDGNPTGCGIYEIKDSNRMIEEFMLLANMAVAHKICSAYPDTALLRRHEPPKAKPLREFMDFAISVNEEVDVTSSASLQQSLDAISERNPQIADCLRQLCVKPMQRAKYFCTGLVPVTGWAHYALNVPMYTHFTSPIRRYCDLIVHRQLDAALNRERKHKGELVLGEEVKYPKEEVGKIAMRCNERKGKSKDAQDASQKLYLLIYLDKLAKSSMPQSIEPSLEDEVGWNNRPGVFADALVYKIGDRGYDVLVQAYGIEKRVWVDDLLGAGEILGCEKTGQHSIKVYWKRKATVATAATTTPAPPPVVQQKQDTMDDLAARLDDMILSDDGDEAWETETESARSRSLSPVAKNKGGKGNAGMVRDNLPSVPPPMAFFDRGNTTGAASPSRRPRRKDLDMKHVLVQTVNVFDMVRVKIVVDLKRSPPDMKLFPMYPEVESATGGVETKGANTYDALQEVSCPGIADEQY